MTKRRSKTGPGRREFLTGVAKIGAAAATLTGTATVAPAATPTIPDPTAKRGLPPNYSVIAETAVPASTDPWAAGKPGSDFMVDVIKSLNIDYVACLPGSSFRGLHESLINYGGNQKPELITCLHEESSVAIAHGYSRMAGKPMATMMHAAPGLLHATMSIYGAFADRAPVFMITANVADANQRRPGIEWIHSVQDGASTVREITKWDDQPGGLQHFAESAVRAYKIATTVPMGPVLLVADADLQEEPIEDNIKLAIPKLTLGPQPAGDEDAVKTLARMLVGARNPVIIADRYARTQKGMGLLVELAELVAAPVIDIGARFNFPNDHTLNHTFRKRPLIAQADVILSLEPVDLWGNLNQLDSHPIKAVAKPITRPDAKIVILGSGDLFLKANFQDFQRYQGADLGINGDAETTMPGLIEAVRKLIGTNRPAAYDDRRKKLDAAYHAGRAQDLEAAAVGWNASPITTARMCMELWNVLKNEDWTLSSPTGNYGNWPLRLWTMNKPHNHMSSLGGGVGINIGSSVGVALANRSIAPGRITVDIQTDGDMMCAPGPLWTAVHHKIPVLIVMHNNRAYHQEVMHIQRMANRHTRGIDRAWIGTTITSPNIDYAKLAQSMGMWSEGPINDPAALGPALQRAIAIVKGGEPALVDVVTEPR